MTYCLAIKVEEGLVFASDSRTNAGLDNIGTYTKMFTYNVGDRAFVILTAGNLATSQAVYHQIEKDLENSNNETNLNLCEDIEAVADYVGKLSIEQQSKNHDPTEQIDQSTTLLGSHFIIGGQIMGQEPNLVMVYPEGNFIYVADETPFIQILSLIHI